MPAFTCSTEPYSLKVTNALPQARRSRQRSNAVAGDLKEVEYDLRSTHPSVATVELKRLGRVRVHVTGPRSWENDSSDMTRISVQYPQAGPASGGTTTTMTRIILSPIPDDEVPEPPSLPSPPSPTPPPCRVEAATRPPVRAPSLRVHLKNILNQMAPRQTRLSVSSYRRKSTIPPPVPPQRFSWDIERSWRPPASSSTMVSTPSANNSKKFGSIHKSMKRKMSTFMGKVSSKNKRSREASVLDVDEMGMRNVLGDVDRNIRRRVY